MQLSPFLETSVSPEETLYLLASPNFPPILQLHAPASPSGTTGLFSVSVGLSILDISYKWNHTARGLSWRLLSLSTFIHAGARLSGALLSRLNVTPLYGGTTFSIICSPANGHLHPLSIMNNAAMNICVQVLLWTCFQFSLVNTGNWNCWVKVTLNLLRTVRPFPKAAGPFYVPTSNVWWLQFSTSLPTFVTIHPFDYSHPSGFWQHVYNRQQQLIYSGQAYSLTNHRTQSPWEAEQG